MPVVGVVLGPLVLRKVGLENFAVLGLATYFFNLASSYSDFSVSTHLLAAFSRRTPERHADFANAMALRGMIFLLCLLGLAFFSRFVGRHDDLYPLLAIWISTLLFPSAHSEWVLLSQRRYTRIFLIRLTSVFLQIGLTLAWFFSPWSSVLFSGLIGLANAACLSLLLLAFFGKAKIRKGFHHLRQASWTGVRALVRRLLPMAGVLLLAPYFLAYALPWYSMVCEDKKLVGSFSIGYRLVMGAIAFMSSSILFFIARNGSQSRRPHLGRTLAYSAAICLVFWAGGMIILHYYFRMSRLDDGLFAHSARVFSILLLGVLCICLRTPYVAETISRGQYRRYFVIHAASCIPIIALSWGAGKRISPEAVTWLACLPDLLATSFFILSFAGGAGRTGVVEPEGDGGLSAPA